MSAGDEDFEPGGVHLGASLELWDGDSVEIVVGAEFTVWYGADIGQGVVTKVTAHA